MRTLVLVGVVVWRMALTSVDVARGRAAEAEAARPERARRGARADQGGRCRAGVATLRPIRARAGIITS